MNIICQKQARHKQTGFLLPAAIFLVVMLAGLGAYAVNMNAIQQQAGTQDIQGVRAYHAARGGIEWAVYQIMQSPVFPLPACPADTTLTMSGGFTVTVTCSETVAGTNRYSENGAYAILGGSGGHDIEVYQITSTAKFGAENTNAYTERQLALTLSKCTDGLQLCR